MNDIKDLKAALAGPRSHAKPMPMQRRVDYYSAQRCGAPLTARQLRRCRHKARRMRVIWP